MHTHTHNTHTQNTHTHSLSLVYPLLCVRVSAVWMNATADHAHPRLLYACARTTHFGCGRDYVEVDATSTIHQVRERVLDKFGDEEDHEHLCTYVFAHPKDGHIMDEDRTLAEEGVCCNSCCC